MYFRNLLLLAILIGCQALYGFNEDKYLQEFREVIEKTVDFSTDEPDIYISNRYGDIDITTTDGTTATLVATIIVDASNKKKADRIMDRIDVDISSTNNSLKAITSIESNDGWNITKKNESYHIHYTIKIPKSSALSVENKYGDISITELDNDLDVELKYGNGQIQDIGGDVSLELGYVKQFLLGNVSGDADIELQYSKFKMQDAGDIELESKYSEISIHDATSIDSETKYDEITINKTGSFTNDGKYDEIEIGIVDEFSIKTKYTHIDIGTLHQTGLFYTGYGKVTIDKITAGFEEIEIESKYTGFEFNISGGYALKVDSEHTSVSYPDDFDIDYRDKDKNDLKIKGTMPGSGNGAIMAKMRYGKLRIRN